MACVRMRVVDRSVLKLIRMWLEAPGARVDSALVVEPGEAGQAGANALSTLAPGVISPLLSNLYLHWFDKLFHRADGPAH